MSAVRSTRLTAPLAVLAVAVLALSLSGCGRRGPLEAPRAAEQPEPAATSAPLSAAVPGAVEREKPVRAKKPDRSFILDPLI